ncbi:MAG: PDZ domain-containing protein [Lactobacillales bacterium]|nr:PDZ domain-containing protein [Lactobacillales bacterium]
MKNKLNYLIGIIISLFVGCMCTLIVLNNFNLLGSNKKEIIEKTINEVNVTETDTLKNSIDKVYDAVVVIQGYENGKLSSTGTGFYYKKDSKRGYIITNHHVIEDSDLIKVTNTSNVESEATLLGSDEYLDIAILSVDAKDVIKVAKLGDTSKVNVGDTVFTVGSPLGIKYMGTVTKGILSGKNRQVTVSVSSNKFIMDVLQTDAAINPGNSGGPLLNINGEVIGVTSLKLVQDEIEGMGFALPIESVKNSLESLENGKEINRPVFGVQLLDVENKSMLRRYGIELSDKINNGAIIIKIEKNTSASESELKVGDIIVKINDDKVKDSAHFRYCLYKYSIGDTIKVTYNRNGKENTISVKLTDKS